MRKADFLFPEKKLAVYLDGEQVHDGKETWDQQVTMKLTKKGYRVLRIQYKPPLSKRKAEAIAKQIKILEAQPP